MGVLKTQICSRHTSRTHNLWVKHNTGPNPVTGWFCNGNQELEWLVVLLILRQHCGVGDLNGISLQQKHLRQREKKDSLTSAAAEVWDTNSYSSDESHTGGDVVKNY